MDGSFCSSSEAGPTEGVFGIQTSDNRVNHFPVLPGRQGASAGPARRESCRIWSWEGGKNTFRLAQELGFVTDVTPSETTMNPCDSPIDLDCFQNGRGERIRTSDPLVPNQFFAIVEIC